MAGSVVPSARVPPLLFSHRCAREADGEQMTLPFFGSFPLSLSLEVSPSVGGQW